MNGVRIISYEAEHEAAWNAFVAQSRNGTFLHSRTFMDYHADRFEDRSAIAVSGDEIVGLFAAHAAGQKIASHNGMTFGGLVYGMDHRASLVCDVLGALIEHYGSLGFSKMTYKPVPHIFHKYPSEEDLYAIFRQSGKLIRRDLSAVIPPNGPAKISTLRKRGNKKALKNNVAIREGDFYGLFHKLLEQTLKKHGADPVHSLSDFDILKQRVPDRIKLIGAFEGDELVAGTWLFLFGHVIHTQYLASSQRGQEIGALDMVIFRVLELAKDQNLHVSFGASTESGGAVLNEGLMAQKEGFGARAMVLDQYEIAI
ncbi:hypothetical protein AXZ77_0649 [Thioclava sp. ES.031]|uniref:GNAT family N-acetyltransferase n=1 Tax=Thioclava sp. ES.031 TaxID=1798203 RepID=UPI000BF332D7|nr:GNAT family N-acetyltransferase [Thioclava sp. ES.031]PFG62082.1 hypothetical protein AXZ77_0649 [Thioclava sp. ES.031]